MTVSFNDEYHDLFETRKIETQIETSQKLSIFDIEHDTLSLTENLKIKLNMYHVQFKITQLVLFSMCRQYIIRENIALKSALSTI